MVIRQYNPAMIGLARESRGWAQKHLAEAVGVGQATICKYELGSLELSTSEIDAIAHALRYSPLLFSQMDQVHALGSSVIFHRKRVRIPIKVQRRVQAEINLRHMQVVRLLRSVEHDHTFPTLPPEAVGDNPERVARQVREMWGIKAGPLPDLTRVVENAGGIVVLVDFGTCLIDGVHLWISGTPPVFFMSQSVPGDRYRFSLAHEVGHAVMHHSSALDDVENEANLFASEFLMPRSAIRSDLRALNLESAARLKKIWRVSMQALIMRAGHLRQISESTRRRLFSHLGARGYRKNEPWPIPPERPSTVTKLIDFHKIELGLTDDDLVRSILFTDSLGVTEHKPTLRIVRDD